MLTSTTACLVLACLCACVSVHGDEADDSQRPQLRAGRNYNYRYCTKAQSNIDLKELMGLWNVIEVIEHNERHSDRRNYLRMVTRSDSCPVVHFATGEDDREVRMLWNDEAGYIQYSFTMTNMQNPGFWISSEFQTGTMVDNQYDHFSGTAQVMKAVQSHMVLTFCSPHQRHFSVIMARTRYLSQEEIRGVHKQLNRVNLPLVTVQEYCRNSAGSLTPSLMVAVLLVLLASSQGTS